MKLLLMLPALGLMWPSAPPTAASPPATSVAVTGVRVFGLTCANQAGSQPLDAMP